MDRDDLECPEAERLLSDLEQLASVLAGKGLEISSWYGLLQSQEKTNSTERINRGYGYKALSAPPFDKTFPWFLCWEIFWVWKNAGFQAGQSVLDLGGSSSLFSFYLANKGMHVTTVDLKEKLVKNADSVAASMGWKMDNLVMDMRNLKFDKQFDHIVSICVYEHIPMYERVEINRKIKVLLKEGGRFSITFDFRNPSDNAKISMPDDIRKQFVEPSGLEVVGNQEFVDNGKNYLLHPFFFSPRLWKYKYKAVMSKEFGICDFFRMKRENDYTFGALFLKK